MLTFDETYGLLSRSCLPENKLRMILSMAKPKEIKYFDREHIFVAVRLIQFYQNHQNVKNLSLTVPDGVRLKPPYLKGISDKYKSRRKKSLFSMSSTLTAQTDASLLSLKYDKMQDDINKLQSQLQRSIDHVLVLKQENDVLRQSGMSAALLVGPRRTKTKHNNQSVIKDNMNDRVSKSRANKEYHNSEEIEFGDIPKKLDIKKRGSNVSELTDFVIEEKRRFPPLPKFLLGRSSLKIK